MSADTVRGHGLTDNRGCIVQPHEHVPRDRDGGMSETAEADYLRAASTMLGLPIRPEHEAEVRAAFAVIAAQARLVTEFPLPDDIEAAPRFTP